MSVEDDLVPWPGLGWDCMQRAYLDDGQEFVGLRWLGGRNEPITVADHIAEREAAFTKSLQWVTMCSCGSGKHRAACCA